MSTDTTHVQGRTTLRGAVLVPGDKSASHRALMISALANGESSITGLSAGLDVRATSLIMEQLGASRFDDGETVVVCGPEEGLRATSATLDCGNSGTTMRLLCGLVSGVEGTHRLVGDESLSRRPMDRVAVPLTLMGSTVRGEGSTVTAPLVIEGHAELRALNFHVPTPSAQVKSAIMFAALAGDDPSTIEESVRTRATTEFMFAAAGIEVVSRDEGAGRVVTIGPGRPSPRSWQIPGDPSQGAFFCVLGAIHPDARIEVLDLDGAPERTGFVEVLRRMGASLTRHPHDGTVTLTSESSQLRATAVHAREIPSVDEVPALAVAAAAASGVSSFLDMGELRLKESDRFEGSMSIARSLGCRAWSEGDDFFVEGLGSATKFARFDIDAGLDHRIVMASAVAGAAGRGCGVRGADTVASSYPNFFRDLDALG